MSSKPSSGASWYLALTQRGYAGSWRFLDAPSGDEGLATGERTRGDLLGEDDEDRVTMTGRRGPEAALTEFVLASEFAGPV